MKRTNSQWIKYLDKLCSEIVRSRDSFVCQHCGVYNKHNHAAHIFSRNNKSVRWLPQNLICLCFYCHIFWAHRNPVEFTYWVMGKIGDERYNYLYAKHMEVARSLGVKDFKAIEENLKLYELPPQLK